MLPKDFVVPLVVIGIILQLVFFIDLTYLYGSTYESGNRVSSFHVAYVDYDGGLVGESLSAAYENLKGPSFPTIIPFSIDDYPTVGDLEHAVWTGRFWGVIYTHSGASQRLSTALYESGAASSYDPTMTMTYIWNEVVYPSVNQGYVRSSLITLTSAARVAYNNLNGTNVAATADVSDPAVSRILLNPFDAQGLNLNPTQQGPRVLLNTVTMVMAVIPNFFFAMALNGIMAQTKLCQGSSFRRLISIRYPIALIYTFLGGLVQAGYIWEFRENWGVNANQFVLTWMTLWLFWSVNFLIFDAATAFIPLAFISIFVVTYVLVSVTGTIYPFELSAGFYRWGYALPSHETYSILITVWGRGSRNKLHIALPIMFSWVVIGSIVSLFGNRKRLLDAAKVTAEAAEDATPDAAAKQPISPASPSLSTPDEKDVEAAYPDPKESVETLPQVEREPTRQSRRPSMGRNRSTRLSRQITETLDIPVGYPEAPLEFETRRHSTRRSSRASGYFSKVK